MFRQFCALIGALAVAGGGVITAEDGKTTDPPIPRPYAFGYAAGRFPGHIDRTHSEVSDGSGVVQGSYSYVDPRHKIRTVHYVADKNGFHPILNEDISAVPNDTPVVAAAKSRHLKLYSSIANEHQTAGQQIASLPRESKAVEFARNKHLDLFQQIAAEHARIAAERRTESDHEYQENYVQN